MFATTRSDLRAGGDGDGNLDDGVGNIDALVDVAGRARSVYLGSQPLDSRDLRRVEESG